MTPEVRQLTEDLRRLRETAGLSLSELAARTPYSKSSWARYLNGEKPVPYDAVVALCRVAGERPDRLLALWELADAEWSGRGRSAADAESETGARRGRRVRVVALAAGAAVAAGVCAAVLLLPDESADSAVPPPTYSTGPTYSPGCTGPDCDGQNPVDMGCGGDNMVTTAAQRTFADGQRVELRHGATCNAVWARATRLRIGDRVELTRSGAGPKEVRAAVRDDTTRYLATTMTPADDPAGTRVCLIPAKGERVCIEA
ncbi:helix-turn-helix domain-containing protein [Streptomyces ureilyticus]|uniref:Helix-turn-helix domain-containing protein n=1 Tax=Streptomyces ureilyticus TaxID=1775131 RepID=A0ABX0DWS5_9ACTN|nr:XRE family transcriptional regulator [Streptomyces ureilyticus]NGO44419.1 helix-turn-helix domain-containing protein [Streptomyces ureilyticus]